MKNTNSFACLALTCLALVISQISSAADAARPAVGTPNKVAEQSGFVSVKGRHFQLGGKPYYFAGANLWYGMYLGSPGKTGDRARLAKELDQLAAQGVLNLRVLAISEASTLKRSVTPAVVQAPMQIDETLWQGLDYL